MIDYKDLMIGNWVYLSEKSKCPMRVQTVGENYCDLNFEGNEADPIDGIDKYMMPIEVTEELLKKIGFNFSSQGSIIKGKIFRRRIGKYVASIFQLTDSKYYIEFHNDDDDEYSGFHFQYLHELQNGIRLITKNYLDIKL